MSSALQLLPFSPSDNHKRSIASHTAAIDDAESQGKITIKKPQAGFPRVLDASEHHPFSVSLFLNLKKNHSNVRKMQIALAMNKHL